MNSPLENRKVRLRGLGAPALPFELVQLPIPVRIRVTRPAPVPGG
jgi:hypothetical protein